MKIEVEDGYRCWQDVGKFEKAWTSHVFQSRRRWGTEADVNREFLEGAPRDIRRQVLADRPPGVVVTGLVDVRNHEVEVIVKVGGTRLRKVMM